MKTLNWLKSRFDSERAAKKASCNLPKISLTPPALASRSKYGNIKDGGFDSKKEKERYFALKTLQDSGKISALTRQVKFYLQNGFRDIFTGKYHRPITYIADFVYFDEIKGVRIIEDVKGFKTKDYKIKAKLMMDRCLNNTGTPTEINAFFVET